MKKVVAVALFGTWMGFGGIAHAEQAEWEQSEGRVAPCSDAPQASLTPELLAWIEAIFDEDGYASLLPGQPNLSGYSYQVLRDGRPADGELLTVWIHDFSDTFYVESVSSNMLGEVTTRWYGPYALPID